MIGTIPADRESSLSMLISDTQSASRARHIMSQYIVTEQHSELVINK